MMRCRWDYRPTEKQVDETAFRQSDTGTELAVMNVSLYI
jgi:hypothetical protein